MKFNEWLATTKPIELTEDGVIHNQLEQLVNKVNGILHNVSEDKREEFLNTFIEMLQAGEQ